MKSQSGITLVSLTIYVIGVTIVVAIVAVVSNYFYSNNANSSYENVDLAAEYVKFNSFFSDEVNHENIKVLECNYDGENNYIVFDNGVQYTFIKENKAVYRNQAKIARQIDNCKFTYKIKNGKNVIEVNFEAGSLSRNATYTLKN